MIAAKFAPHSLKKRIILAVMAVVVAGLLVTAFLISRSLRKDMETLLGDQQLANAEIAARSIDQDFRDRLDALRRVAQVLAPTIPDGAVAVQRALEQQPIVQTLFNGGITVYSPDGTAIADVLATTGQPGVNYMDIDVVAAALKEGRTTISRPVIGKKLNSPAFGMGVPIRDPQGRIIGSLAAVVNLDLPSFIDNLSASRDPVHGTYLLVAPQHRIVVTSSNRERIMEVLPPPGVNPGIDKAIDGFEGSMVLINPSGVEVLVSIKLIPSAGWYLAVALPTEKAFAPILAMQQRLFGTALLLTLLIGAAVWWLLQRQLKSMQNAAEAISVMIENGAELNSLPVASNDEVGQLVSGFNKLLDVIRSREDQLRDSETRFRSYFELPVIGVAVTSLEKGWVEVNSRLCEIFGYSKDELLKLSWTDITHPDDLTRDVGEFEKVVAGQSDGYTLEKRFIRNGGEVIHAFIAVRCVRKADGVIDYFVALVQDIEDRKRAEAELRIAATAFDSNEGMVVTDAQSVILRVNKAFTAITGYTADEAIGKTPRILKSGQHDSAFFEAMWRAISETGSWQGEIWDKHKSGHIFPKWLTISAVRNNEGAVTHYVGAQYDITERKEYEKRINALAFYDQLTNLPNRTLLIDRLTQSISSNARNGSHGALMFIDLDNFKTLNDTQGHEVGDQLLKQVAMRLKQCLREEDTAARQGGDEFVVVLAGLGVGKREAAQAAEIVAGKILAQLREPYLLGDLLHRCTTSIGVTLFQGYQYTVDELLKQGDLAMYKSKAAGRNAVRFYDPALEADVQERALLENDLRVAVEAQQFFLHYQPQVADTRVIGAEVLVRWRHPQRGVVSPAEFIPLAEETDLILPLGDWVLRTACQRLALWAAHPELAELTVAVNVSARQFRCEDYVARVLGILRDTGANPQRLKLELTESLLAKDIEQIIATMHELKAHGVGFSLDDFGTGYSSLSYLKRLPLDQLKIDQSFVRDVLIDANDAAIAKTVVVLGQTLGLSVIAEGVETEAQRAFLASNGCFTYQGYLFSRPVPVEELEQLLQAK